MHEGTNNYAHSIIQTQAIKQTQEIRLLTFKYWFFSRKKTQKWTKLTPNGKKNFPTTANKIFEILFSAYSYSTQIVLHKKLGYRPRKGLFASSLCSEHIVI